MAAWQLLCCSALGNRPLWRLASGEAHASVGFAAAADPLPCTTKNISLRFLLLGNSVCCPLSQTSIKWAMYLLQQPYQVTGKISEGIKDPKVCMTTL